MSRRVFRWQTLFLKGLLWIGLGIVVGGAWSMWRFHALPPGFTVGVVGGCALALFLAFPSRPVSMWSFPPWTRMTALPLLILSVGAVVYPESFYDPSWVFPDMRTVARAKNFRVDASIHEEKADAAMEKFLPIYRQQMVQFFGEDAADCDVRIFIVRSQKHRDLARRFNIGDFGFATDNPVFGPSVTMSSGSGWGTMTHVATYAFSECLTKPPPRWAVVGVASLMEKFTIDSKGNFNFRWRSDWRRPDQTGSVRGQDLPVLLLDGPEQGLMRSFFRFLHARGWLFSIVQGAASEPNLDVLFRTHTGLSCAELGKAWQEWARGDGMKDPPLPEATPQNGVSL